MREYLGHLLPELLGEIIQPANTALLIVDMQNDFVHADGYYARAWNGAMGEGFRDAFIPISRIADGARLAGVHVLHARVVQLPDGSLASPVWLADNLRNGMEPLHCMSGTWGAEIIDELAPQPGDIVFDKTRRSCFQATILANLLQARAISTIVVVGVGASGCVESTVRDAIERDYFVVVPRDAIANNTVEKTMACHADFLALLGPMRFTTTDDLLAIWGQANSECTH
jgi:ureidoacrylate peracid hydrolase